MQLGTNVLDDAKLHPLTGDLEIYFAKVEGTYAVQISARFAVDATGDRGVRILRVTPGVTVYGADVRPSSSGTVLMSTSAEVFLKKGDSVRAQVFQSSGGPLNIERDDC